MIALSGIPRLQTARLVLRAPDARDLPAFTAYAATARAGFTGGPHDALGAFRQFNAIIGHWVTRGHGFFAMEEKATGEAVGFAGLLDMPGWPEPELAWNLWSPAHEGRGFAREAAEAVRAHAYRDLGWTTLISLIVPENIRSQALARKLGASPEREETAMGKGFVIWRHPGPDALAEAVETREERA